jgi:hypothetical protein
MDTPFIETRRWRFGFLAVIGVLLLLNLCGLAGNTQVPGYVRFGNLFMALALLLNHIAGCFIPKGRVRNGFWILAFAWIAFVVVYMLTRGFSRQPF